MDGVSCLGKIKSLASVVVHICKLRAKNGEVEDCLEFEASLGYLVLKRNK